MSEVKSQYFDHPILIAKGDGFFGCIWPLCVQKQVDVVVIDNLSKSDLSNLQKVVDNDVDCSISEIFLWKIKSLRLLN